MHDYTALCYKQSKITTKYYSSSFYLATKLLDKKIRQDIYAIYGLVRVVDELVDTLRPDDMKLQLNAYETELNRAMQAQMSLNPIMHSFALTYNKYHIPKDYIEAFFESMHKDIKTKKYSQKSYQNYIYGSAEVVGLMCLYVFCSGKKTQVQKLQASAQALGSAFQKVNFLRDMQSDYNNLSRVYFPKVDFQNFREEQKQVIVAEVQKELQMAKKGIDQLPYNSRYAVALAYGLYHKLLSKIDRADIVYLRTHRIRLNDAYKFYLLTTILLRKLLRL